MINQKPHLSNIQQFRQSEIDRYKSEHPNVPYSESFFRSKSKYDDKTANGLTRLIIRYIKFQGFQAERISTMGRPIDTTKVVGDVVGRKYRIGSVTWIPGTTTPGSADVSAIIRGRAVKWEIKMKDRQSEAQREYQANVERAGGVYFICHSFDEFINQFTQIINT